MEKKALGGVFRTVLDGVSALGGVGKGVTAATLIAAGALGTVLGKTYAKATASNDQDVDNAAAEYENERVKADIDYLSAQLNREFAANSTGNRKSGRGAVRL